MGFVFARTREHPMPSARIMTKRCSRHQLVRFGLPSWKPPLKLLRQFSRVVVAGHSPLGARSNIVFGAALQLTEGMAIGRKEWRIEQHQRVPSLAHALRLHYRSHRREGVKHSSRSLGPELFLNTFEEALEVVDKLRPIMMCKTVQWVLTVIAEIEEDQLVTFAQAPPER